ncbi:TonB-linked outer membrane protein, SusC/RagA family [Pustulibacterium marinum]|uniref:TonB-linked outer membrane protein, SusC/RagA family n=2 Tax=Pustulibacterium marinum TaxID=1224947 RepID=A0A1I7FM90_9FLAO|nr:TonB-linked outer membrane protein, SusC/RagA family [Pustulibacterium marinum]
MFKKSLGLFMFCFLLANILVAQTKTVTGNVTGKDDGIPVPGVNIMIKGTGTGTSTDFDGNFSIETAVGDVLVFSAMGLKTQEVTVAGENNLTIVMATDSEQLDEVVVTALGIKKETKALGYAVTEVGGEELSEIKQANAINSLQGKVAGVNVTGAATGPAGTSKVVIRGVSTLSGNNQPLYVVDGIPIDNSNLGSATRWGGSDYGDGISSINPDDIENISVLKGGAAAALYGSRASNGVILITTKSGKKGNGFGVDFSSSVQFETINTDIYEFQKEYGQGTDGNAPTTQEEALSAGMYSWGAKLDGSQVVQFDGVERAYSSTGDNISRFYHTGETYTNTIAISQAAENYHIRFSATDFTNHDITPNSGMNRKSFSLNAGMVNNEKLSVDLNTKYVLEDVQNRPRVSDSPGNIFFIVGLTPANISTETYKPGINEEGTEYRISSSSTYHQNPYWSAYYFSNQSVKNRFIGSSTIKYQFTDWLYMMGRAGIDQYLARITSVEPYGTAYKPLGGMSEQSYNVKTRDADIMLGFNKDLTEDFSLNALLGANNNAWSQEITSLTGTNFVLPGLEDISNVDTKNYDYANYKRERSSWYFSAEFAYKNYLFLNVTGRQDWFSTLSLAGKTSPNNYFYPSVNSSFVFTDAFDLPEWISFGKVRAGYSDIGGGVNDPYQLNLTYGITNTYAANGTSTPIGGITNSYLPNSELEPFSKKEYEIGTNLKFFNNRLGLDFTYYSNTTTNDIVAISTSTASGYSSGYMNLGELTNKGVEVLLSGSPIKNDKFGWDISYNLGYNKNLVVKTDDDGNPLFPGDAAYGVNSQSGAVEGLPYGAIYGTTFVRDDNGNIQYESNGTPTIGDYEVIGQGIAPWTMGISNNFRYKDFNLSFLIDAKFGADIFSGTSAFANYYGASKNTLVGRENGLDVSGVDSDGNVFSTTLAPSEVDTYYQQLYSIAEANIQSADFIKFREISLGYSVPSSILEKTFISSARVSLIGRNLFFLMRKTENIDPESAYNNTSANGIERFGRPTTRTYGVSLNFKF